MPGLDLSRTRGFSELLSTTFGVWLRHFPVFFTLALLPVAPTVVLVDGLWVGRIHDPAAAGSFPAGLVALVLDTFLVPSLVTAVHVIAVQDLGQGERPRVRRSMRAALPVVLPVSLVLVLYGLAVAAGLIIVIVGAVYFGVRFYFAAQAVVVDGRRGMAALERSGELVSGAWWRVFGIVVLITLVAAVFTTPLRFLHDGVVYVVASVPATALSLSFTALAGTILYFDLRARTQPVRREEAKASTSHPDRPGPEPTAA